MPFKSEAQRRYMWTHHKKIAKRWSKKYGSGKNLPYHKKKKSGKTNYSIKTIRQARRMYA